MGKTIQKLLVICGPTATGKTKLALTLAKKFNGELISADSRQVYKYMDIGTGKDVEGILGYDLIKPDEEFSVSQYIKFANDAIKKIIQAKKLPILVGGTGLYIKAVIDGIETENIAPNEVMRKKLKDKSAEELFKILENTDRNKASKMNDSDSKNPRRLIRAIEIAKSSSLSLSLSNKRKYDVLMIGLTTNKNELRKRIEKRIDDRIKAGFEREIKFLKENRYWNGAPFRTLGYKDWPDIEKWESEEFKYAKRQMTWFTKDKRIKWFDIARKNYKKELEEWVQKWYPQV